MKPGAGTEKAGWDCGGSGESRDGLTKASRWRSSTAKNGAGSQSRACLGLRVTSELLCLLEIQFDSPMVREGRVLWWERPELWSLAHLVRGLALSLRSPVVSSQ